MRIVNGGDSARSALELAIVRYGTPDCAARYVEVDLIAVAHIADAAFYEHINRMLPSYDVVLFELVAPDSVTNPSMISREDVGPMSRIYYLIANLLGMQHQFDVIDYTGANMLHADMTQREFLALLEEHGQEVPDFGAMLASLQRSLPSEFADPDNIDLGERCDRRRKAAVKLIKPGSSDGLFGDVHIIPRNDRVAHKLREQIDAGVKRIAILYGAGHMPDLQERLLSDFGMSPLKRRWLVAWDLCKIATR